jgi:hypothetical protein
MDPGWGSKTGFWIRLDSIRIRIFSSIQIRKWAWSHNVFESGPIRIQIQIRIHNSTWDKNFQRIKINKRLKILSVLPLGPDLGSGFLIRIRIHKVIESGSNPDPQHWQKHRPVSRIADNQHGSAILFENFNRLNVTLFSSAILASRKVWTFTLVLSVSVRALT